MRLIYAESCDCVKTELLINVEGTFPEYFDEKPMAIEVSFSEYYDQESTALRAFIQHQLLNHKFFAVHCQDRHILALKEAS